MADDRDQGFTLIEVVVVTVMLGLVSLVIAFAITTVLRVTPVAESQVDDARSLQGLTAWFPGDAASAVGVVPSPSTVSCTGVPTLGDSIVEFQWTERSESFAAIYRLEPDGPHHTVRRYECSGSAAGTTAQKLTGPLADVGELSTSSDSVTLELQSLDGSAISLEATPRNRSDVLLPPPVPSPIGDPEPCYVKFDTAHTRSLDSSEQLEFGVQMDVQVHGTTCGRLRVRVDTGYGPPDVRDVVQNTTDPTRGTVTWEKAEGDPTEPRWTAGPHRLEVYSCDAPSCVSDAADLGVLLEWDREPSPAGDGIPDVPLRNTTILTTEP